MNYDAMFTQPTTKDKNLNSEIETVYQQAQAFPLPHLLKTRISILRLKRLKLVRLVLANNLLKTRISILRLKHERRSVCRTRCGSTKDKNLNSEIETRHVARTEDRIRQTTKDKNLNSEIETNQLSCYLPLHRDLRKTRISILRLKPSKS